MKIIIIGGGEVGSELAKRLSGEDMDVILIEQNPKIVREIQNKLDVMVIRGNGASVNTLAKAGLKDTDLLIAVTQIDEINIIACMIAKKFGVKRTVARIRNEEYEDGSQVLTNEQLGIDIIINPEKVAAEEITKIIRTPNVDEIEYFVDRRVLVIGFTVYPSSKIVNQKIKALPLPESSIIGAITRENGEVVIPRGEDVILPNDKLYIIGKKDLLSEIGWLIRHHTDRTQNITIFGGSRIGLHVARLLEKNKKNGFNLKLIDKDLDKCKDICMYLNKTMVINGDVTNLEFLKQEDIPNTDVVVAVTGDDEVNLLTSLLAKQLGVKKTISEVVKADYNIVLNKIGVDSIISPRLLTVGQIMKLIRKINIVSLTILKNEKAEIVELIVPKNARIVGKKLAEANLPRGINIGTLVRDNNITIPNGSTEIRAGDRLVMFVKKEMNKILEESFSAKTSRKFLLQNEMAMER